VTAHIVTAPPSVVRPTVSTPQSLTAVEPPSGGDAATSTRDVVQHPGRVAPAPIRALARTLVLALAFFGLHAAASHPIAALTVAAGLFIAACAYSSRR